MTWKTVGVRTDNIQQSIFPYICLFFFLGLAELLFLRTQYYLPQLLTLYHSLYFSLWLVIPLSILQEIVFRGYGMPLLKKRYKSALVVILLNTVLFTLMHAVFPYPHIVLPGAFIAGVGFAYTYYYYPNLLLISLVHVLLNYLPVFYCTVNAIHC